MSDNAGGWEACTWSLWYIKLIRCLLIKLLVFQVILSAQKLVVLFQIQHSFTVICAKMKVSIHFSKSTLVWITLFVFVYTFLSSEQNTPEQPRISFIRISLYLIYKDSVISFYQFMFDLTELNDFCSTLELDYYSEMCSLNDNTLLKCKWPIC